MKDEEQPAEPQPETTSEETPPVEVPPGTPPDDSGKGGAPAEAVPPSAPPANQDETTTPSVPSEGDGVPPTPAEVPPANPEKPPVEGKPSLPVDPFAAMFTAPTVTQEAYDATLADLKKQAQDGTIDMFEYADKVADLKADFKAAQAVAQFAQQANQATAGQKWQYAQDVFKSVHPEYRDNAAMWGALDGMVRQLAQDPEASKLSDIGFLALADEKVKEALGLNKPKSDTATPPAATPDPQIPQPPERAPALDRAKDKLPPSLGNLPAAQSNQPEDEFAGINNMTGLEQEAAVAAMLKSDPAKYDRWLRS